MHTDEVWVVLSYGTFGFGYVLNIGWLFLYCSWDKGFGMERGKSFYFFIFTFIWTLTVMAIDLYNESGKDHLFIESEGYSGGIMCMIFGWAGWLHLFWR